MIVNYKIYHIRVYDQKSYEITCDLIRAFAFGIANAICKRILALMYQISPASGLLVVKFFTIPLQYHLTSKMVLQQLVNLLYYLSLSLSYFFLSFFFFDSSFLSTSSIFTPSLTSLSLQFKACHRSWVGFGVVTDSRRGCSGGDQRGRAWSW